MGRRADWAGMGRRPLAALVVLGLLALVGCGTRLPDSAFDQARGEGGTAVAGGPSTTAGMAETTSPTAETAVPVTATRAPSKPGLAGATATTGRSGTATTAK